MHGQTSSFSFNLVLDVSSEYELQDKWMGKNTPSFLLLQVGALHLGYLLKRNITLSSVVEHLTADQEVAGLRETSSVHCFG